MMTLLDTQVWVWWTNDPDQIPPSIRGYVEANEKWGLGVSAISCLEVARLVAVGRLDLPLPVEQWMDEALRYPFVNLIELSPQISIESTRLPEPFHRDPADRIIVATSRLLNCRLATTDGLIRRYPHVQLVG